jgi:hypothetical protein
LGAKKSKDGIGLGVDPAKSIDQRSHGEVFAGSLGVVYANALAFGEFSKEDPAYPVGSIIVREKHPQQTPSPIAGKDFIEQLNKPEIVIAMVKREKGFSEITGDWEFFQFDGSSMNLTKRAASGNCADCHRQVRDNDWVFRTYLDGK